MCGACAGRKGIVAGKRACFSSARVRGLGMPELPARLLHATQWVTEVDA